jgi:hypothetical protein
VRCHRRTPHLTAIGPIAVCAATVSAFLGAVLDDPARWRLILTVPDTVPREYRAALRRARSAILGQTQEMAVRASR